MTLDAEAIEAKRERARELAGMRDAALGRVLGGEHEAFYRFAAGNTRYAWRNLLLLWAQDPDARLVLPHSGWARLGRRVTKGVHGLRVFTPTGGTRAVFTDRQVEGGRVPELPPVNAPAPRDVDDVRAMCAWFRELAACADRCARCGWTGEGEGGCEECR